MSVQNKFDVGDRVKWNDYNYWQGFHKEDVGFEDTLTVLGYVDGPLVELQSDNRVIISSFDWRFELVEDAPKVKDNSWYENGELPPVGAACECQNNSMQWLKGTIVYVGKDKGTTIAIMQTPNEILYGEVGEFRPIQTPEQIAAEEREKVIEDIARVIRSKISDKRAAESLYELGYRKMEEVAE